VIEDGSVTLADSNAILVYLAGCYDKLGTWYPRDALAAARVQQWLSVAAGQLAAGPATARGIKVFGFPLDHARAVAVAGQLFLVLNQVLASQPFLTGAAPTIADVAMYTYTALAPEGGVSLEPYGNIRAWLARIEALPSFVPMQRVPVAS
jgi:glutathione S-transferase